jgi:transcriptional regulator with XRE-family HTH domain
MDIANVIRELRAKMQWDQEDLASRLGTSQQSISNWETGSLPRASALAKINALLKEANLPAVSLTTVAIKANERSTPARTNALHGLLVIVQQDINQPGYARLIATANSKGVSVFITQSPEKAADLLENLTP